MRIIVELQRAERAKDVEKEKKEFGTLVDPPPLSEQQYQAFQNTIQKEELTKKRPSPTKSRYAIVRILHMYPPHSSSRACSSV